MYQEGLPHEPYFIAIDNWSQVIIGPNKKTVAMYMVGELEMLIWFIGTWKLKKVYCYDQCLLYAAWTRIKGNDNMIGCAEVVLVSTLCSRCSILTWFLLFYDLFKHMYYEQFPHSFYVYIV